MWQSSAGEEAGSVSVDSPAAYSGGMPDGGLAGAPQVSPDASTPEKSAADEGASRSAAPGQDQMLVIDAGMHLRVTDVEKAIDDVRRAAATHDAEVSDLTVHSGESPEPRPLSGQADGELPAPATASITMRVPAEALQALQDDIASVGTVISQTASASDVTQQYVDLAARLKNLKAEEARLRSFFDEATKVSELLSIEQELARVRGEIEAMQAQVDYLERQVARATLTVTLSEPGPVIRPGAQDWGLVDAITRGVQGAAALLGALITVVIALAPLAVLGVVVWLGVRWIRRRASSRRRPGDDEPDAATSEPAEQAG
jgi:hypothetical protein